MDIIIEKALLSLREPADSGVELVRQCMTYRNALELIVNLPMVESSIENREELKIPIKEDDLILFEKYNEIYSEKFISILRTMIIPEYKILLAYGETPKTLEYGISVLMNKYLVKKILEIYIPILFDLYEEGKKCCASLEDYSLLDKSKQFFNREENTQLKDTH